MPQIIKRPAALADLAEIWNYIADDSEANADAFLLTIDDKLSLIATQPGMGRLRSELAPGLRSFPVGRYIILYQTLPIGIEIVRVLHSARDLDALL